MPTTVASLSRPNGTGLREESEVAHAARLTAIAPYQMKRRSPRTRTKIPHFWARKASSSVYLESGGFAAGPWPLNSRLWLDLLPAGVGVEGLDLARDLLGALAEILLEHRAVLIDNEGHDA